MSVYTVVSRAELERFLDQFAIGPLVDFAGISAGIENTNYFVTSRDGRYVLTLFEFTPAAELPYFLDLMAHLAERGVPSAHPVAGRDGAWLRELNGRPAALVARLPGASVSAPDTAHCAAIGAAMARMHQAAADYPGHRESDRGPRWRAETVALVAPRLAAVPCRLLESAVAEFAEDVFAGLPAGVIHADLFRDNALFDGGRLTGIIDFYYAFNGPLIYDLAVAVADWCFDTAHHGLDTARARALVGGYAAVRAPNAAERSAWPQAIRAAGLRFWLSRLKDQLFPRDGALTHIKDPRTFERVLLAGRDRVAELMAVWD